MSFREKIAWIQLASIAGIYGLYFWDVVHRTPPAFHFLDLLGTIIALVVVQVILTSIAAIFAPREAGAPSDERDQLIDMRSTRLAYAALVTGMVCACFFGAMAPPLIFNTSALLFILVAAELMRLFSQVYQYRRTA